MIKKTILLFTFIFLSSNYIFSQKVIEMTFENGIYTIPCKVNGIPMKFVFDTGASNVSISITEAKFLIKQGLLNDEDIIGSVQYKIANGEVEEGTKIILKEINIDGYILHNVEASIVHQLNAPLLLGQSAISKLGTFEIDGGKLTIQSNNYNKLEFLGIDLTMDIEDFGLSKVNLNTEDPFLPIDFEYLKISNNHFLKDIQFDKQKVLFDNKGNIAMIVLQKLTAGNGYEKEVKSNEIYKSLVKKIEENYWITQTKKKRNATWESKDLELLVSIDNENSINLIYVPKIFKNLSSDLTTTGNNKLKSLDKSDSKKIKDLRLNIEKAVNKTLNDQSSQYIRKFARISNNNFEFHSEIKIAYEGSKKEVDKANKMIAFNYLRDLIISDDIKYILLECDFDYLTFTTQITDKYHNKTISEKKISKKNLMNLKVPFTENEITEILE
ncbi:retropepsin-like aspartic protease family protein [Kaistella montana]|uniref:TIGR02281 family clan AA aspartic protease n=1 Tax=Kaistella montana TaxID=1849733 RepID=A0ABW5K9F9_9FLAO|nr:retropepsin-like aspartic protease [Kaistella montana]MCQ4035065.1 retroviral-like aspartic protease family protein [Kaistella montana]